jgi:hypothetical protein
LPDYAAAEVPPKRTWREIAYEMIHETNRVKVIALSRELSEAFETQQKSKQKTA